MNIRTVIPRAAPHGLALFMSAVFLDSLRYKFGAQFLTSNPYAGLDWPVRILVTQDAAGKVWVAYTDFSYIAARYDIEDRAAQIKMASEVAGSIAGSVKGD